MECNRTDPGFYSFIWEIEVRTAISFSNPGEGWSYIEVFGGSLGLWFLGEDGAKSLNSVLNANADAYNRLLNGLRIAQTNKDKAKRSFDSEQISFNLAKKVLNEKSDALDLSEKAYAVKASELYDRIRELTDLKLDVLKIENENPDCFANSRFWNFESSDPMEIAALCEAKSAELSDLTTDCSELTKNLDAKQTELAEARETLDQAMENESAAKVKLDQKRKSVDQMRINVENFIPASVFTPFVGGNNSFGPSHVTFDGADIYFLSYDTYINMIDALGGRINDAADSLKGAEYDLNEIEKAYFSTRQTTLEARIGVLKLERSVRELKILLSTAQFEKSLKEISFNECQRSQVENSIILGLTSNDVVINSNPDLIVFGELTTRQNSFINELDALKIFAEEENSEIELQNELDVLNNELGRIEGLIRLNKSEARQSAEVALALSGDLADLTLEKEIIEGKIELVKSAVISTGNMAGIYRSISRCLSSVTDYAEISLDMACNRLAYYGNAKVAVNDPVVAGSEIISRRLASTWYEANTDLKNAIDSLVTLRALEAKTDSAAWTYQSEVDSLQAELENFLSKYAPDGIGGTPESGSNKVELFGLTFYFNDYNTFQNFLATHSEGLDNISDRIREARSRLAASIPLILDYENSISKAEDALNSAIASEQNAWLAYSENLSGIAETEKVGGFLAIKTMIIL
ncbi:MAG: hypothetical protein ABIC40_02440, partial [bacterium]